MPLASELTTPAVSIVATAGLLELNEKQRGVLRGVAEELRQKDAGTRLSQQCVDIADREVGVGLPAGESKGRIYKDLLCWLGGQLAARDQNGECPKKNKAGCGDSKTRWRCHAHRVRISSACAHTSSDVAADGRLALHSYETAVLTRLLRRA